MVGAPAGQYPERQRDGKGLPGQAGLAGDQAPGGGERCHFRDDRYTYRVTWSEEDKEHVGLCVEFPSLSWLAPTPEAALRGIRRAVADVVADLVASDEPVPEPLAGK